MVDRFFQNRSALADRVRERHSQLPSAREAGFTLVEVIIAFSLLMVILIPTAQFLSDETIATGNLRNRVVAANLVDQMMETVQEEGVNNFSALETNVDQAATTTTQKVGGVTYTLALTKRWQNTDVAAGDCASNGNGSTLTASTALLFVEAAVTWPQMNGTPPVAATTTIAQPYDSSTTTGTGTLELLVVNAAGAGTGNLPLTLTDNDTNASQTLTTDSNGCLFVPNLPSASTVSGTSTLGYTLTFNTVGDVDLQNQQDYPYSFNLSAGATENLTGTSALQYGPGGTINVTYTGGNPPSGMPFTISNPTLTTNPASPAPGSNTAIGPLWPYSSGYSLGLGDCSPAMSYTAAPTTGGTANLTIALDTLNLTVYNSSGAPASGATVDVANQTGCSDHSAWTATTASNGTVTIGLPSGTFQVSAYSGGSNPTLLGSTTVTMSSNPTSSQFGTPTTTTTSSTTTTTTTTTTVPSSTTTSSPATTTTTSSTTTTTIHP